MTCPECGGDQLAFIVPTDLREFLPEKSESVAICTHCLALDSADAASAAESSPDFRSISDALPGGDAGAAMALAVGLLDSLVLHRTELTALLERAESAGTDPLLVLDRLATDSSVDPHVDLDRRRTQVEQLLYE